MLGGTAYAQRSLGSDNVFIFDNLFNKASVGKKNYNAPSEHIWDMWVHDFHFYEGAGYSKLAEFGNGSWGNNVGLGYALNFLNPNNSPINLSLFTGAEFGIYNASYKNLTKTYSQIIDDSPIQVEGTILTGDLSFNARMTKANEKSSIYYVNIPIMLRYTFAMSVFGTSTGRGGYQFGNPDVDMFYVGAGVKIGLPITSSYQGDFDIANTYMIDTRTDPDREHTNQQLYGLKSWNNGEINMQGKLNPKMSVMFAFEFGYILPLQKLIFEHPWQERVFFYGSLFFDYALNRIASQTESPISFNYADPTIPIAGSITETSPMHNMTIGLKIGVWYSLGRLQ
jgi:hypothetical protein